mmetsp:Transcript_15249/g.41780  ORF Transcript_15249/g.41780 Transcript_15249/m.41780 type:complete len:214 (-) Transcript_15249:491-1132(-)
MSSNVLELARAVQQLQEQIANERVCRESEVSFLWDEVFRLRSEKNGPLLNGTMMEPQRVKNGDERCQQNVHNERVVDDAENHVEKNTFLFDSWDMEKTVEGKSEMQRLKQEADRVALDAQIAMGDHRLHQIEEHFEEFFRNFALVENLMQSTQCQIKDHRRAVEAVRTSLESTSLESSSDGSTSRGDAAQISNFGVGTVSSSLISRMGIFKWK